MKRLVLMLMFLGAMSGCSGSMAPKDDVRVNDEPTPPELSCREMEGDAKTSVDRQINFENISFSVGEGWIKDVEYFITPECILTRDDYKPDLIGGRTIQFNLRYSSSDDEARISVFKIEDYRNAFARYPQYIENRDAELRTLIADSSNLKTYGVNPPPHVTWMDAHQAFYAKAAKVDFANGVGLLTVTDISVDAFVTISNSRLRFLYQGFTSDGKYFVEMNFPVKLKGLLEEEEEFESGVGSGWKVYNSPEHLAAYKRYVLKTAAKIDKASPTDFRPALGQIEKFIYGFEIK